MLWAAPELLRMPTRPPQGTPKGDVYSVAIILQEIIFRANPFFLDTNQPRGTLFLSHLNTIIQLTIFMFGINLLS